MFLHWSERLDAEQSLDGLTRRFVGVPDAGDLIGRQMLVEDDLIKTGAECIGTHDVDDDAIGIDEVVSHAPAVGGGRLANRAILVIAIQWFRCDGRVASGVSLTRTSGPSGARRP